MNVAEMLGNTANTSAVFQRTPEWYQARIGKLTASRMAEAMSFKKNGAPTKARERYMMEIVAERQTDIIVPHYVTPYMEWGTATEPEAKDAARKILCLDIHEFGFVDHPEIDLFGASPDGGLEDDGLIEIKCPQTATHMLWLKNNVVPEERKPQMIAQLLCTGRRYCKFMSYDPRFTARPIFYKHFAPTQEERDSVENAAIQFLNEAEQLFELVTTSHRNAA